jgi:ribosome-dependent ATPase
VGPAIDVEDLTGHEGGRLEVEHGINDLPNLAHGPPLDLQVRMRYNQAFVSVNAEVPGSLILNLLLIPVALAARGVVREKEVGSITNFYASPSTRPAAICRRRIALLLLAYFYLFGF